MLLAEERKELMRQIPTYAEPSHHGPADDPALSGIRANVAGRLACVCGELAADDFAQLVDRIARFQRRWEIREAVERETLRALERARSARSAPDSFSGESRSGEYRPD